MLLVLLVGLTACSEPTPEERVAQTRARYEATLNGFVVQQQPIASPPPPVEGSPATGDDDASLEETADVEGSEETAEIPIDLSQDVLLDIVIRQDSFEKLDGITVDITMADGERELQVWRVWFDTSGIEKGPGVQYSHTLENVDYQPGYGFSAEVRHPVPAEERGEYKEFADLGG
jgi:hypothetical protein